MLPDNGSSSTQTNGSGGELVLECESEALSDAQLNNIERLKEEVIKLQKLLQINTNTVQAAQKASEITVPVLVNGSSTSAVAAPMTNGPNMMGLQVPQFLLLQNGQMIAASSSLQPATIATNNQGLVSSSGSSFPITTTQNNVNGLAFKQTNATRSSTNHLSQALTRTSRGSLSNGKSSSNSSAVNNNSDGGEIQVLSEIRPLHQSSSSSRGLKELRISAANSVSTNTTNNLTTFRQPGTSTGSLDDSDPMNAIPVLGTAGSGTESRSTSSISTVTTTANISTNKTNDANTAITATSSSISTSTCSKYPLLNISARPRNTLPPTIAMNQRKELDTKVKLVLVKSPQEFVEWLLSEGMIRSSQSCAIHKITATQQPYKLKLGMFSDPKALATSGGYVWINECCGKKYISVYSGSIFGSTPIDKVPPTSVLKLIYHWSCQTSISNVENWVKVDKNFINKMFQYLRCVCSVMLQDKVYDFGFDGTTVELGIVSLGTSTADGTKKAVKVEILGLYDRKMKSYRLFASEPEPGSSSRQRFVRILKPLERVVHPNALILCDQSVDRNCLYNMSYARVSVCETNDNEDSLQFNARIMTYLRKHVPKMFQSALSQLNLQQVQLVLDELCWRERYGHCAAQAYINMLEHIIYLTAREAENPGVLHLLDFVAQSPHHNWRYKSQHLPKGPTSLQPSIIMNTISNSGSTINPQMNHDPITVAQSPLDHNNKVLLTTRRVTVSSSDEAQEDDPLSTSSGETCSADPDQKNRTQALNKKKGDPALWKRNVAKKRRASGKAYVSVKTKRSVPARAIGVPCTCAKKCFDVVGADNVKLIFENYWKIANHNAQSAYLTHRVETKEVARHYHRGKGSRDRNVTYEYSVIVKNNVIRTCKTAFLNIHGIGRKRVECVLQKVGATGAAPVDLRGSGQSANKLDDDLVQSVHDHLKGLLTCSSHYSRAKAKDKVYLPPGYTMHSCYKFYKKECQDKKMNKDKIAKKVSYRKIFYSYNIGTDPPQSVIG